jgi:hypothetical protein
MLTILDIRSGLFRAALTPRALPCRHAVANDKPEGDVSALAERWMR